MKTTNGKKQESQTRVEKILKTIKEHKEKNKNIKSGQCS